ncbi:MAG: TrkA family potassium uptake protein [Myxococcales bacterium]|nr:TrkA family potassium uptake protein [Myxococcales bacterium]
MKKQALVIGLGQFGMSVVRSLDDLGVEVMAVDSNAERVRYASEFAEEAVAFDATDEASLGKAGPKNRDLCVCAIGDEAREASILCTALLRQMGAARIIARAADPLHERILRLIGAHEVINPERAFGEWFATHLAFRNVRAEYPFGRAMTVSEVALPAAFVGRTLAELALPRKHGITIAAIQRGEDTVVTPRPDDPLEEGDVLIIVALKGRVAKLMERYE